MKIKVKPELLSEPFEVIKDVLNEARINVIETGISISNMDKANVIFVSFELESKDMLEFEQGKDESFGIVVKDWYDILKSAKGDVVIEVKDGQCTITTSKSVYKLPLLEEYEDKGKVPKPKYTTTFTADATVFNEAISDKFLDPDESLKFNSDKDKLEAVFDNGQKSKATKVEVIDLVSKEPESTKISIEFLRRCTSVKVSDNIKFGMGNSYPLGIDYQNPSYKLGFIIAPRIDND